MERAKMVPELTVSDFAESLAFYTQMLGFEGARLMPEEFRRDGWNVAGLDRPYGRGGNLQIECSDAGLLRNGLVGSGYPLYREVEDVWRDTGGTVTGSRKFLVQDPDGYLRFSQHPGERGKARSTKKDLERGRDV